jgi:hypothetical protein
MFKEQSIQNKIIEDIKSVYHHKFIEVKDFKTLFSEPGQLPENLDFLDYKEEITNISTEKNSYGLLLSFRRSFPLKSWIIFHLC